MDFSNLKELPKGSAALSRILTAKWHTVLAMAMTPYRTESSLLMKRRHKRFVGFLIAIWQHDKENSHGGKPDVEEWNNTHDTRKITWW